MVDRQSQQYRGEPATMLEREILPNGWAIVDISDRYPYSERKGKTIGVEDEAGKLLCAYSTRNRIAAFLSNQGIEAPHQHQWWRHGEQNGQQRFRCVCGATKTDGEDRRGRPKKKNKC